jgi:hypothetical protein
VGEREYGDGGTEVLARTALLVRGDKVIVTKLANAADGLLVQATTDAGAQDAPTTLSDSRPETP